MLRLVQHLAVAGALGQHAGGVRSALPSAGQGGLAHTTRALAIPV